MQKHNLIKLNTHTYTTLGKEGIEWNFFKMTKSIHKKPTARIILNGEILKAFLLRSRMK